LAEVKFAQVCGVPFCNKKIFPKTLHYRFHRNPTLPTAASTCYISLEPSFQALLTTLILSNKCVVSSFYFLTACLTSVLFRRARKYILPNSVKSTGTSLWYNTPGKTSLHGSNYFPKSGRFQGR
jgi:hypothetical protein